MQLRGRALFNLLRINWVDDPSSMQVAPWQVEDYRALADAEIYKRLSKLDISLTPEGFARFAEECDTPEELVDCLWVKEEDLEGQDRAYLLLFELWRRHLPEKHTLSIFCDELDDAIERFDRGETLDEEKMKALLTELEDVLDQTVDEGEEPASVFRTCCAYCAHDLEGFLCDYIAEQIDNEDELYASELLDGFSEYISDENRFAFLRARLFESTDPKEFHLIVSGILEQLKEEEDKPFLFEIVAYLVHRGDVRVYMQAVHQLLEQVSTEEEFQRLLGLVAEYFRCTDREKEEDEVKGILSRRASRALSEPIDRKDAELSTVVEFLKNL